MTLLRFEQDRHTAAIAPQRLPEDGVRVPSVAHAAHKVVGPSLIAVADDCHVYVVRIQRSPRIGSEAIHLAHKPYRPVIVLNSVEEILK